MISEALRAELAQRREEHGTLYTFQVSEDDIKDLASGYVPQEIVAMARFALSEAEIDQRRAARPVKTKRTR